MQSLTRLVIEVTTRLTFNTYLILIEQEDHTVSSEPGAPAPKLGFALQDDFSVVASISRSLTGGFFNLTPTKLNRAHTVQLLNATVIAESNRQIAAT
jgi:hypothetical protein